VDSLLVTHELGHLAGARHEDANCAESAGMAAQGQPGCTIMFANGSLQTGSFSTSETAFIRHTRLRRE